MTVGIVVAPCCDPVLIAGAPTVEDVSMVSGVSVAPAAVSTAGAGRLDVVAMVDGVGTAPASSTGVPTVLVVAMVDGALVTPT